MTMMDLETNRLVPDSGLHPGRYRPSRRTVISTVRMAVINGMAWRPYVIGGRGLHLLFILLLNWHCSRAACRSTGGREQRKNGNFGFGNPNPLGRYIAFRGFIIGSAARDNASFNDISLSRLAPLLRIPFVQHLRQLTMMVHVHSGIEYHSAVTQYLSIALPLVFGKHILIGQTRKLQSSLSPLVLSPNNHILSSVKACCTLHNLVSITLYINHLAYIIYVKALDVEGIHNGGGLIIVRVLGE